MLNLEQVAELIKKIDEWRKFNFVPIYFISSPTEYFSNFNTMNFIRIRFIEK